MFVVDTSSNIGSSGFQLIRELVENITINLKFNSPETLFGLIRFSYSATLEFNITKYSDISTLLPAINPGIPYYYNGIRSNIASGLSLLLSGSVEGGILQLRNKTSKVALVITDGVSSNHHLLQSAANSLHAANIFDVYAVGIRSTFYRNTDLPIIASHPSLIFSTTFTSMTAQQLEKNLIERLCSSMLMWHNIAIRLCIAIRMCTYVKLYLLASW